MTLKDLEPYYRCVAVFGANENGALRKPIMLKQLKIEPYCLQVKVVQSLSFFVKNFAIVHLGVSPKRSIQ